MFAFLLLLNYAVSNFTISLATSTTQSVTSLRNATLSASEITSAQYLTYMSQIWRYYTKPNFLLHLVPHFFFLQACHEEGKHILFRNDPIMNGHFLNIARRAKAAPNESLILVSFLAALTLLCVVIAATIFAMRRRSCIRSQSNTFYEQTSPRLRQSDYTLITSEDAW